jgi:hypothetical protein
MLDSRFRGNDNSGLKKSFLQHAKTIVRSRMPPCSSLETKVLPGSFPYYFYIMKKAMGAHGQSEEG